MQIAVTELFTCTPETLWAHITETEKQKLWMKGLLSNEPTSPAPVGVGSTFRMVIKEGRKSAEYQGEITAYDKRHRLEIVIGGGNLPKNMKMRADYRLTQQGPQTRLDYLCKAEVEKPGLFMKLMFVVFRLFGKMQLRGFMKALRKLVEDDSKAAA